MLAVTVAPSYTRIQSLDLSRGIAVLAILVVNIWAFALPFSAYANPPAYGDMTGANFISWFASFVLVQEKFITIFSMLFGAGVALFADHARAKGLAVVGLHYRRMLALLIIGLLHGYGIWSGDILTVYAVLGMLLYWFIGCSNRTLLIMALALIALSILLVLTMAVSIPKMPAADLVEMSEFWQPTAAQIQTEISNYRGNWRQQQDSRLPTTAEMQFMILSFYSVRLLGQMLLGVWLYRSGFFAGERTRTSYVVLAVLGLGIGLTMATLGARHLANSGFVFEQAMGFAQLWNNIGSLLAAIGYLSLFILWSQSNIATALRNLLTQAGRMGFSLYLGTSLICTTLFYGHGVGLFAELDRFALFGVVLAVWLVLLGFANWWLARYPQGPLEQFWRFCTYGSRSR